MNKEAKNYYALFGAIFSIGAIIKVFWTSVDLDIFAEIENYSLMLNYSFIVALSMIFIVSLEAIFVPFFISFDKKGINFNITWRQLKLAPILFFSFYLTLRNSLSFNLILISLIIAFVVLVINIFSKQSAFYVSNCTTCNKCLKTNSSIYYIESILAILFLLSFILAIVYFEFFENGKVHLDIMTMIILALASTYSITFIYKVLLYYTIRV